MEVKSVLMGADKKVGSLLHFEGLVVLQLLHHIFVFLSETTLFPEIDPLLVPPVLFQPTHQHLVLLGIGRSQPILVQLHILGHSLPSLSSLLSLLTSNNLTASASIVFTVRRWSKA